MTASGEGAVRLPKRFYKTATASEEDGAYVVRLDGKIAKTHGGKRLQGRSAALMSAIAEEWSRQGDHVDFSEMPLTQLAMAVADLGEISSTEWRKAVISFLKSDLLCYRAAGPDALVERQEAAWTPILDWASQALGIRLLTGSGVAYIEQPEDAIITAARILDRFAAETLLVAKKATEVSGSAVIALALVRNAFPPGLLFDASRVDEAFQAERWGRDAEACEREAKMRRDFLAAADFLSLA